MSDEPANADRLLEEQIVSYLDGELDEQASRQIEQRLGSDVQLREKLQQLDRTWDLLEELDTEGCAANFTQTTLEMVTSAAAAEVRQTLATVPRRRRRRWMLAAGSLLVASVAGFLAVTFLVPDANKQLIRDLPVLENFDKYRWVEDAEFLRMLHKEDLFAEEENDEP